VRPLRFIFMGVPWTLECVTYLQLQNPRDIPPSSLGSKMVREKACV
jgi:hypothetical protein